MTKICTRCQKEKPLAEFRYRPEKGLYMSHCRECEKEQGREYHRRKKLERETNRVAIEARVVKEKATVTFMPNRKVLPRERPVLSGLGQPCPHCGMADLQMDPDGESLKCWVCGYHRYESVDLEKDREEQTQVCRSIARPKSAFDPRYGDQVCTVCGNPFYGTATRTRCPECDKQRKRTRGMNARLQQPAGKRDSHCTQHEGLGLDGMEIMVSDRRQIHPSLFSASHGFKQITPSSPAASKGGEDG